MKKKTLDLLNQELDTHEYGLTSKVYTLQRLFDLYLKSEVETLDDIFVNTEDFENFVMLNKDKFKYSFLEEFNDMLCCMVYAYNFAVSCAKMGYKEQNQFADITKIVLPDDKMSVLDVGTGKIPISSYLLAKKYRKVTAMDQTHGQTIPYHSRFGVKFADEYFTPDTKISSYDALVGRRPCQAIPIMVETAAKMKKPYFIDLCNCWASGESYFKIIRYLQDKDNKLRVNYRRPNPEKPDSVTVYIHNLELSSREIQDAMDSTELV